MSRGLSREMINVNSSLETINAAATAIASAEFRVSPPVVQKRRWSISWSVYWCFGSQKNSNRTGHSVLVPEPTPLVSESGALSVENATQPPTVRTLFVAPPSSPASFLPSEPPSAAQSPVGSVGLMYSPSGPHSMFAIGPYAHETQLVTPPVFSTYTTEPSTAPFTPPPESLHFTTPSSPEVPFAQLLHPIHRTGDVGSTLPSLQVDFLSYLLQPGSPVGPLISPSSAVSGSGTSSPLPDHDITGGVPQKLLTLEAGPNINKDDVIDHNDDDNTNKRVDDDADAGSERVRANREEGQRHLKQRGASLGTINEFNFDHVNGINSGDKPSISSSWWANEKVVGKEGETCKNWSFFPLEQPSVG